MSRKQFFDAIRPMFGKHMTAVQVGVIEAILDGTKGWSDSHIAYTLATAFGEAKCTPVRENMNYSAERIRVVWPTRPEAVRFARQPKALANSVYGDRLGNRDGTDDGWNLRGGGLDQLTGRDHYELIGIADRPDDILKPDIAVKSLLHGMSTGRYRSLKLSDFDRPSGFDFINARGIVNNDVKLNGQKYAGYARLFLVALALLEDEPAPDPEPVIKIDEPAPDPVHETEPPADPVIEPEPAPVISHSSADIEVPTPQPLSAIRRFFNAVMALIRKDSA